MKCPLHWSRSMCLGALSNLIHRIKYLRCIENIPANLLSHRWRKSKDSIRQSKMVLRATFKTPVVYAVTCLRTQKISSENVNSAWIKPVYNVLRLSEDIPAKQQSIMPLMSLSDTYVAKYASTTFLWKNSLILSNLNLQTKLASWWKLNLIKIRLNRCTRSWNRGWSSWRSQSEPITKTQKCLSFKKRRHKSKN